MRILVTGSSGFIGYHLCNALIERGDTVIGIDNIDELPYGRTLKLKRASNLKKKMIQYELNIVHDTIPASVINVDVVVHLAALAGVRNSILYPTRYVNTNINGWIQILREFKKCKNFIFASSSSVYGGSSENQPCKETDECKPVSLYGVTKRAGELIASIETRSSDINITAFRFFTVYGTWGRPDMALYKFMHNILNDKPITVYGHGKMKRDFTYVDDIVQGIITVINNQEKGYNIYNLGANDSRNLTEFIEIIEKCIGKKAIMEYTQMQNGDVVNSSASTVKMAIRHNWHPKTSIDIGIPNVVKWFVDNKDLFKVFP